MTTHRFTDHAARRWLFCSLGLTMYAGLARGQSDGDWARQFRLGMQMAFNIKADFSLNGQFPISGHEVGPLGVSGANHFYDDGYVRVDQTGNAQGYTSYWGYNSSSQYDPAAQTLSFHSARSFSYSGVTSVSDAPYVGLDVAYGGTFVRWSRTRIGWELGFGWLPIVISDRSSLSSVFQRTVHTFDTAGIVMPTAPYNGGQAGVGPTIHDVATGQPDDTVNGTVTGSRSVDVSLYNFRLGPTFYWDLSRRLAVQASGGFALGLVSGDYRFDETILLADGSLSTNNGRIGSTDTLYGGYVNAMLIYHVQPNADLFLGAQFMSLGTSTIGGEGRQARLDLGSGIYVSAGINWQF
jgi:hypothetical protein